MTINTQNAFWSQVMGRQKSSSQFLTGSMKAAEARRIVQNQEFLQKVSGLKEGTGSETQKKQTELLSIDQSTYSEFLVSEKDVPKAIADEMDRYRQGTGNVIDNLTGMEEQLKYLQEEYDKAVAEGNTEKASAIEEWTQKQYQDMSWITGAGLGISHFRISNADRLYGKAFGGEAKEQLGDLRGRVDEISQGLKGAGSVEEALEQIAAAKEKLMGIAGEVEERYQAYTGNQMSSYEYKTAQDFAGIKWDSHLILKSGNLQKPGEMVPDGYLVKLDLSQFGSMPGQIDLHA
ncbi:MAG: hypothetical protein HFG49_05980 [Lachnospiraceae bacterium]|jgi:hypothetical protein|nr:hypothetical protein [Lachnospiraceae bacterium]